MHVDDSTCKVVYRANEMNCTCSVCSLSKPKNVSVKVLLYELHKVMFDVLFVQFVK